MKINYGAIKKNPRAYAESLPVAQLVSMLKLFDHYYHDKNDEKVSDNQYDTMKTVLEERSPKNKYLKAVGSGVGKGKKKVKLLAYMPSLKKLKPGSPGIQKLLDMANSHVLDDKLDGISLQLVYVGGRLKQACTRGKGKIGQDVSAVIPALNCPKIINAKDTTAVRAELVIRRKTFKQFSTKNGGDWKTDRNMGGGLLNRKEPPDELKHFDVVAYEVMVGSLTGRPKSKQLTWLKAQKFQVPKYSVITGLTEEQLIEYVTTRKRKSPYPIDGIVVTPNKSYKRVTTGYPEYQKAFKINSDEDSRVAVVKYVEYNISRNGMLAPRIVIEPIELGGVTVTHFTGHNLYFIEHGWAAKDAGKYAGQKKRPIGPGAKLKVIRSGDVIPYIQEVLVPAKKPQLPDVDYKVDKHGKKAVVVGKTTEQRIRAITHFFSVLKIDGIKDSTVRLLFDNGYDTLQKILEMSVEDMERLPRFTINKATTLRNSIDKGLNDLTFARLGTASGVFKNMGEKKLEAVYEAYPQIMAMVEWPYIEVLTRIQQVRGFKDSADAIALGLPKFVRFVKKHNLTIRPPKKVVVKSNTLNGKAYLFTGVRDAAAVEFIKANGGKLASSVKSANVLIVKDSDYSNKKTDTARQLGIPVVAIDKFKRKYGIS